MDSHVFLYFPALTCFLCASCIILFSRNNGILSARIIVFSSGIGLIGLALIILLHRWIHLAIGLSVIGLLLFLGGFILIIRHLIKIYGFPKFR